MNLYPTPEHQHAAEAIVEFFIVILTPGILDFENDLLPNAFDNVPTICYTNIKIQRLIYGDSG